MAFAGRGTPESEAVREHVEDDCGAAPGGWLENQERGKFSCSVVVRADKCQRRGRLEAGNKPRKSGAEGPKRAAMPPDRSRGDLNWAQERERCMLIAEG